MSHDGHLEIYLTHRSRFVDYAAAIVGNRALGEEIVQEAYLRFKDAKTIPHRNLSQGYLQRIVRNLAIDLLRKGNTEKEYTAYDENIGAIADDKPSPEEIISQRHDLKTLSAALDELPPRMRAALEMHRFEGFKLKEIAERMNISITLAHSLVSEGLLHCRNRLSEHNK
ncbi:sigma-70 family RNA polymerase sigma factor [Rosenbergiella australiborealis]|uniref:sigma-70 family RNA polymerase sigma factor n=1 Tax=Rosenbergiella australiborealis TaxID=1544696 RepID=UPI001F4EDDF6|nr:sigma-70 family RNA polymerase sigma factor [Rosenbergiella australiborealis]